MSEEPKPEETQPETPPESLVVRRVREQVPDAILAVSESLGEETLVVRCDLLHACMAILKSDPELKFDFLADITAVDQLYLNEQNRFVVVYHLCAYRAGRRLRVKTPLPDDDLRVASIYDLWPSADWLEREVYDMYGIVFDGHPDLRRLLMPDDFGSYPLRKDYPLHGKGERDNFVF
ncbi:MAG: NADH-quinone oxidoreductase subunit C [candidate division Zixibacteria bacterium]|nr:NADH-quinone oxidoreductase subunit C [candidate division Zixibacteria bacterium]